MIVLAEKKKTFLSDANEYFKRRENERVALRYECDMRCEMRDAIRCWAKSRTVFPTERKKTKHTHL